MNKYAITGIILSTFIIIAGLGWSAQPKTQVSGQANSLAAVSALKSDSNLFDFGTISMSKGKVAHKFQITNNSGDPVTLNKIFTSCMCTAAQFELNGRTYGPFGMEGMGGDTSVDAIINPGDTAVAEAIYDPNAHGPAGVGSIDRYISLQDTKGGTLQLEIRAVVTP